MNLLVIHIQNSHLLIILVSYKIIGCQMSSLPIKATSRAYLIGTLLENT